jgi:hypothetical protein
MTDPAGVGEPPQRDQCGGCGGWYAVNPEGPVYGICPAGDWPPGNQGDPALTPTVTAGYFGDD